MAAIELSGISRKWGETIGVDKVSFRVEEGSFAALLGPSGCGKSTTLRMIAGLEEVSEGTLTIGDVDMTAAAPAERNLSMVFQSYAIFPHLSVEENILFGLKVRKIPMVVYVTHDQAEAMSMADRVILIREGKIEQKGTPDLLYDKPATAFTAAFIGTPPMNLLKTAGTGDGVMIESEDQTPVLEASSKPVSLGIRPEHITINHELCQYTPDDCRPGDPRRTGIRCGLVHRHCRNTARRSSIACCFSVVSASVRAIFHARGYQVNSATILDVLLRKCLEDNTSESVYSVILAGGAV